MDSSEGSSDRLRSQGQRREIATDPADADSSAPSDDDLHDEIMATMFTNAYRDLPPHSPAGHMHIVDWRKLNRTEDVGASRHIYPRLCDAVATVIYEIGPKHLEHFLDARNKGFSLTQGVHTYDSQPSFIIIRRSGHDVIVGRYHTLGFKFFWSYYVKATIDSTGKWTETFASSVPATTNLTEDDVVWQSFELVKPIRDNAEITDLKIALSIARELARWMLKSRVWLENPYASNVFD